MSEFLTIKEVSILLKIHRVTISRWVNSGVFPNAINFGRTKRIPISDIEALKSQPFKKDVANG